MKNIFDARAVIPETIVFKPAWGHCNAACASREFYAVLDKATGWIQAFRCASCGGVGTLVVENEEISLIPDVLDEDE